MYNTIKRRYFCYFALVRLFNDIVVSENRVGYSLGSTKLLLAEYIDQLKFLRIHILLADR